MARLVEDHPRSARGKLRPLRDRPAHAPAQLGGMTLAGIGAGVLFARFSTGRLAPLVGWDVAALAYLSWVWARVWPMDAGQTARLAVREDPGRGPRELLLLSACSASLLAVAFVLTGAKGERGVAEQVQVGVAVASVLISWAMVHTVFTARYARIYYTGIDGGINFNQSAPPRYSDFAYVAFTVGLTFQVSDTNITSGEMRGTVLRHALLAYLFGAVIIAVTINLLAGLVR
ncbi:DUF1345 domain-containing protein [Plantactinospora siamensis]|uniref:DUF1345 domain-containing protein n=1 Tax=Plantactinospora siamensis TaxID=555372 RepID=A0ABV6P270_9ACTN